jgi:transposase
MDTRQPYDSDLTDAEWAILGPLVPAPAPNGRPAAYARRDILDALLYVNRTGCQWRYLPHDFPPWPLVYYYFKQWRQDGTWEVIHDALRAKVRRAAGRRPQPTLGILDSQSVKMVDQPGERGFDGGKRLTGRKRHVLVDTLGLLLMISVTAASVGDRAGAQLVLARAKPRLPRLRKICADAGYRGAELVAWVQTRCQWLLEIVAHLAPVHHFLLLPRRWVVERTFGWWIHYRRLSKDYEVLPASSEALIRLTMINLMTRRLARQRTEKRQARRAEKRSALLQAQRQLS